MITIYDKLLSSLFNLTDSFILTILLIVIFNSLITKIIEVYSKGKTKFIRDFNDYLTNEPRIEQVLIPLRDGVTLARRVS